MYKCNRCGNTKEFQAKAIIHEVAIVNNKGEFIDWKFGGMEGFYFPDIEEPTICNICESEDLIKVRDSLHTN